MKKLMVNKDMQVGWRTLFVAVCFVLNASISLSAQVNIREMRARWEKLMYEDAKALIQETTTAIAKDPKNAVALRMRSSAFYRDIQPEKGKADAAAAFALLQAPGSPEEYEAKCYAERRLEKFDEAIASCSKAIELDQKFAWAYYNRGNAAEGKKLYPQALADYSRAIE